MKMLIVDDSTVMQRKIQRSITLEQITDFLTASNGLEAVEIFKQELPELVTMDLTMPEMSGEETFDRLKQIHADVPIIISSGYDEAEASRRFIGKGVSGFLKKPYTAETLAERTNAALAVRSRKVQA